MKLRLKIYVQISTAYTVTFHDECKPTVPVLNEVPHYENVSCA